MSQYVLHCRYDRLIRLLISRLLLNTAGSKCAIDVVIEGPPMRTSWYDLWGAAVITVAVCARFGKDGVAAKIGIEFLLYSSSRS